MRILLVNRFFYPDVSATSQLMSDLGFHLAARGHDVCALTSRQAYGHAQAGYANEEQVRGLHIYRCWSFAFGRGKLVGRALDYLSFYISVFFVVLRRMRRGDILVATTDPPLLGLFLRPAALIRGAKLVNWHHDLFPEIATRSNVGGLGPRTGQVLQILRNRNCRTAHANVVLGQRMQEFLVSQGIPQDHLTVIPNWAPKGLAPYTSKTNYLRGQWNLTDRFVIAYAGNLGRVHEFETLLSAAQILQHEHRFAFLFVGGGAKLQAVRDRVTALNIDNVTFQDYQPRARLAESLSVADVHIVSLKPEFEALVVPSKIYGIAAVARPAVFIGAADGEVANILGEHAFGYSVVCNNAETLATLIKQIATSSSEHSRLCNNAAQAHANAFAAEHMLARWEALLVSI